MLKKARINNEIGVDELRLIDEEGKNIGLLKTTDAIQMAKEKGLDLIEISPKAKPPIAKIMDYGKFLYQEKKKDRVAAKGSRELEMKNIRIHLATSENDLNLKARKASEFLKVGHRLKLELFLKGREKYLDKEFLEGRLKRIINLISEKYKVLQEIKKGPRGLFVIVEKVK
ncbi:MAG: translation initiation factor IF-3 [Patescibacteria group bacterium]